MPKSQLIHHKVLLTKNNANKLAKGENTLLKHEQLLGGEHDLFLTPVQSKKLLRNAKQGKGVKVRLSPQELDHNIKSGNGLGSFLKKSFRTVNRLAKPLLKSAVKDPRFRQAINRGISKYAPQVEQQIENALTPYVGKETTQNFTRQLRPATYKNVNRAIGPARVARKPTVNFLDSDGDGQPDLAGLFGSDETEGGKLSWKGFKRGFSREYKRHIKPIVAPIIRQGLKTALSTAIPAAALMTGQPQLIPLASGLADQYGDSAINALGKTTGAFGVKGKRGRKAAPRPAAPKLKSDFSNFLNREHPAMNPGDTRYKVGGSFRPAGY